MRHWIDAPDLLPPELRDREGIERAMLFEPGDPLPPGALAIDLAAPEQGVVVITGAAPRAPDGGRYVTNVAMRRAIWEALIARYTG
ncbi:MAG: hypothetical protein NZ518_01685 [Dehalococcoidia bacterium]|nr:hypothetical protein [Dehalococcoidia bacterium]